MFWKMWSGKRWNAFVSDITGLVFDITAYPVQSCIHAYTWTYYRSRPVWRGKWCDTTKRKGAKYCKRRRSVGEKALKCEKNSRANKENYSNLLEFLKASVDDLFFALHFRVADYQTHFQKAATDAPACQHQLNSDRPRYT